MKVFSFEMKRKFFNFGRIFKLFKRGKKIDFENKIIIGKTDNKAIVSICKNCEGFPHIPHFSYFDTKKKKGYSLNFFEAKMLDHDSLLDMDQRIDLEYFFSKYNEEEKMTNWELAIKTWNENYEVKIPDNLHRPYYINIQEEHDDYVVSTWENRRDLLEGMQIYCDDDIEAKPHFHIRLPDSCNVAIYFDKAEYLYPLSRKLTEEEIQILIKYLSRKCEGKYVKAIAGDRTNWEYLIHAWNNENTGGSWCYYQEKEEVSEDLEMPDYSKLNENWRG